jgi:hypothetical protein
MKIKRKSHKPTTSFKDNHVILVEGFGDVDFFAKFFQLTLGQTQADDIILFDDEHCGTIRNRLYLERQGGEPSVQTRLKDPDTGILRKKEFFTFDTPKSLFVIVDSDGDVDARFKEYQKIFKESACNIQIDAPNKVVTQEIEDETVDFGIFVIGDKENTFKYLETFVLANRTKTTPEYEAIVNQFISQCENLEPQPQYLQSKSKVAVYLASMPKWRNSIGDALNEEAYFRIDYTQFDFLKALVKYFSPTP